MDFSDKCISFNGNDYIVVEQLDYDNLTYVYLMNDVLATDTMFVEIKDDKVLLIDPKIFEEKIFPMFIEKFKKQEN